MGSWGSDLGWWMVVVERGGACAGCVRFDAIPRLTLPIPDDFLRATFLPIDSPTARTSDPTSEFLGTRSAFNHAVGTSNQLWTGCFGKVEGTGGVGRASRFCSDEKGRSRRAAGSRQADRQERPKQQQQQQQQQQRSGFCLALLCFARWEERREGGG